MDGGRRSRTQQKFSSGARTPSRMYGLLFSLINRLALLSAVQGEAEFIRLHTHTASNSGSPGHDPHAQRPGRAPTRPRFCTPTDHHAHPSLSPTHAHTHSYGLGTATNQCPARPAHTMVTTTVAYSNTDCVVCVAVIWFSVSMVRCAASCACRAQNAVLWP